jgi:hypothetical protein
LSCNLNIREEQPASILIAWKRVLPNKFIMHNRDSNGQTFVRASNGKIPFASWAASVLKFKEDYYEYHLTTLHQA